MCPLLRTVHDTADCCSHCPPKTAVLERSAPLVCALPLLPVYQQRDVAMKHLKPAVTWADLAAEVCECMVSNERFLVWLPGYFGCPS